MNAETGKIFLNQQIREYVLTDIIGSGGMGTVYKGYHVHLKTTRAIKVLKPMYAQDEQFKERFEREARILARLENPNVIRIYEFFQEQDHLFLVMEYAAGESLADKLDYSHIIPVDKAVFWIAQACSGLAHAHANGIVHRDLSPDNLIITQSLTGDEIVKIIDFGIAKTVFDPGGGKTLVAAGNLTTPGIFIGKVKYCSPEQASGKQIDHRSDQYSLALILYEAITGVAAFHGETPMESLTLRLHEPPPKLAEVRPGSSYPTFLEEVISRALEKDPDARFPDILAFQRALNEALADDTLTEIHEIPDMMTRTEEIESFPDPDNGFEKAIPLEPEENSGSGSADPTVLRSVPELTDINEDFKAARSQPRWVTPLDAPPLVKKPRTARRVPPPEEKPSHRLLFSMLIIVFVIGTAIGGLFYFRPVETKKQYARLKDESTSVFHTLTQKITAFTVGGETKTPTPKNPPKNRTKPRRTSRKNRDKKSAANDSGPFLANAAGVVPPKKRSGSLPVIPVSIDTIKVPSTVHLQLVVLKNGTVGSIVIPENIDPIVASEIEKTVKQWKYRPGTKYGRQVDIFLEETVQILRK